MRLGSSKYASSIEKIRARRAQGLAYYYRNKKACIARAMDYQRRKPQPLERRRENARRFYDRHAPTVKVKSRRYYWDNHDQVRNRIVVLRRWTRYGLKDYDALLARQGGRCAICRTDRPGGVGKHFRVDHDHVTKKIRGLLCNRCNVGLGMLGDDYRSLERAIRYLARAERRG